MMDNLPKPPKLNRLLKSYLIAIILISYLFSYIIASLFNMEEVRNVGISDFVSNLRCSKHIEINNEAYSWSYERLSIGVLSSSWNVKYVNLQVHSGAGDAQTDTLIYQTLGIILLIIVIIIAVGFVIYMLSKKKKIYPPQETKYPPIRQCPKCMQVLYYSINLGVYYCYYCKKHYHEKQLVLPSETEPQLVHEQSNISDINSDTNSDISMVKKINEGKEETKKENVVNENVVNENVKGITQAKISSLAKCPKCKTIIKLETTERPVVLQCPNCGTKGTLK